MEPEAMLKRVELAYRAVEVGEITPQQFALYVRKVASAFLKNVDDPDDENLKTGIGDLGEAPRDWGEDADFTSADAQELAGGDDMDAPKDYDIG